jgi:hypothetical protein
MIHARIRVAIGEMPQLLRDIVRDAIMIEPDLELIEAHDVVIPTVGADVLVVAMSASQLVAVCPQLLHAKSATKVLAIGVDDGQASLFELCPRRTSLGDLSPRGLVDAIRQAVHPAAVE